MSIIIKRTFHELFACQRGLRDAFKIVALAIFASILLGFAAHGSSVPSSNISTTNFALAVAKLHLPAGQSWARAENISVCRFNAL